MRAATRRSLRTFFSGRRRGRRRLQQRNWSPSATRKRTPAPRRRPQRRTRRSRSQMGQRRRRDGPVGDDNVHPNRRESGRRRRRGPVQEEVSVGEPAASQRRERRRVVLGVVALPAPKTATFAVRRTASIVAASMRSSASTPTYRRHISAALFEAALLFLLSPPQSLFESKA